MRNFFKELFAYNHYTNQKLGDAFNANTGKTSEKAIKLYSHILNAHHIWNNRAESGSPAFGVWDAHPVKDFKRMDKENYERTLLIIDQLDLDTVVAYTIKGKPFRKAIRELLFHVINHSTYHRGQIATEFRQSGIAPLVTEYILYEGA